MGISFRTKLFLGLLLTALGLLGSALWAMDRAYRRSVEELVQTEVRQGRSTFDQAAARLHETLLHECELLASAARVQADMVEGLLGEVGRNALYEMEYHHIERDFLSLATAEGLPVARFIAAPGSDTHGGAHHEVTLEPRPVQPAGVYPETSLVQRVVTAAAGSEPSPFLVVEGRLFEVVAYPMLDRGEFLGVVVLGSEITDRSTDELHAVQADHDGVAYAVGPRLVAASLGGAADRPGVAALLARWLTAPPARRSATFEAVLGDEPYRVVITALHEAVSAEPVHAVLLVSLKRLRDLWSQMQRVTLAVALLAVVASLVLSAWIARGIAAPVRSLVEGTERVSAGDYGVRLAVRSRDELGALAGAFNRMAQDLATKEKVRAVLNKVVDKNVAEELLRGDLGLGGSLTRATLLFADLRGFTALTEGMDPRRIVAWLNEFLTAMSREIQASRGIVDKYVGDEIIGIFGAPRSHGEDPRAAILAAQRMRERLEQLNAKRVRRGDPPLRMGIGIHTGDVVVGCMGSEELLSYTCIGAPVNLASRLGASAAAGQILISETTWLESGRGVEVRRLEPIRVKGFREPVPVLEVLDVPDAGPGPARTAHTLDTGGAPA